jgi:hypothetical protein
MSQRLEEALICLLEFRAGRLVSVRCGPAEALGPVMAPAVVAAGPGVVEPAVPAGGGEGDGGPPA